VPPPEKASRVNKDKATELSQFDEFREVMKPRTKKGPAWANDMKQEEVIAGKSKLKQEAALMDTEADGVDPAREAGLSDLDWMRQRMSKNVDVVEKVFEQSDEEDEDATAALVRHFLVRAVLNVYTYFERMLPHQFLTLIR